MSQLSVQLYSVRDAFAHDPTGTLERLAGLGFTQVEPYGVRENLDVLREALPALSFYYISITLIGFFQCCFVKFVFSIEQRGICKKFQINIIVFTGQ